MPATRLRKALAALVVLVAAAIGVGYAVLRSRTGDVSHPNVEFRAQAPPRPVDRFTWPLYGYTKDHTREFSADLAPPFRRRWTYRGHVLLEFPPVIAGGNLYQLDDGGVVNAIAKQDGKVLWRRRVGRLAASSPAAGGNRLFVTILDRGGGGGRAAALSARHGRILWSRDLPAASESSPMLDHGTVYFGSQDGTVYALRARDGSIRWTFKAGDAVKGSPTLKDGILYFGDYAGQVHAIRASSGRLVWSTATSGAALGSGTFYATAAVAFGRVYIGNTDGHMYSFSARTGKLAWGRQTGNYVYASAAVAETPGLGPTVYVGSYDGVFYAFDARSGDSRWTYDAHGKISGSPTIVGRTVYFANLAARTTEGLDTRTGRRVFHFGQGSFDPVISDGHRIYLTGYRTLSALEPK